MAGLYPDVPNPRIAYDRDGTIYLVAGSRRDADMVILNREGNNSDQLNYGYSAGAQALIFPTPRTITHYFHATTFSGVQPIPLEWSNDTTNGVDGSWTTAVASMPQNTSVNPVYRTAIVAVAGITNVKSVRMNWSDFGTRCRPLALHLYGPPASTLRLWHATLNSELAGGAEFDWGDVTAGSGADRTFRVKNTSATQTAQSILLGTEILYDGSPTVPPQFTFSADGVNFSSSLNIGDLAPGAISGVITRRRGTPVGSPTGLWAPRFAAVAGAWA